MLDFGYKYLYLLNTNAAIKSEDIMYAYDSLLLVLLPSSVLLRSHILLLLVIGLRRVCGEAPGGIFGPLATRGSSSILTSHHLLELLGRDGI